MEYLPKKLYSRLMPFQKDGISYAVSKNGRCLIGDEMGLGKTLQAISIAWYYKREWPVLIIVPSSLKYPWIEEIEKWLPEIDPNQINLIQGGADIGEISTSLITLVTYGLLRHPCSKVVREALTNQNFKIIIVDESHYMKNRKSATSKFLVPLIQKAERKLLLTGTPALARPEELFPQLSALLPKEFGKFGKFAERYCDAHYQYFGKIKKWMTDGASNLEELQNILRTKVMIRRLKKDVLTQLPPKQRQKIPFEIKDSDLKKDLDTTWAELHKALGKKKTSLVKAISKSCSTDQHSESGDWFEVRKNIIRLYHKTCTVKVGPVKDYIKMLCENQGLKFIVFAYHHVMINSLVDQLMDDGIKFIRIDGSTLQQDRPRLVHQFQVEKSIRVAILSIKAAGVGLTLTAAKLVVFAELDWTPGALEQCEDRAHRIGQKDTVHIHYLVAKGTLDEWVWSALARKTTVVSTTLNGETQVLQMDEGNQSQIDCLTNAEAYTPSQDSQENIRDFFNNSQLSSSQRTMFDFFTPGGTKRPVKDKLKNKDLSIKPIVLDTTSDGEGNDSFLEFKTPKRKHPRKKSILIDVDDSDTEGLTTKGRKVKHSSTELNRNNVEEESEIFNALKHLDDTNKTIDGIDISQDINISVGSQAKVNSQSSVDPIKINGFCPSDNSNNSSQNGRFEPKLPHILSETDQNCSIKEQLCTTKPCSMTGEDDVIILSDNDTSTVKTEEKQSSTMVHQSRLSNPTSTVSGSSSRIESDSGISNTESSATTEQTRCKWSCSACTFDNHRDLTYCEICNTPQQSRPKRAVETSGGRSSDCIVRKTITKRKRKNAKKVLLLSPTTPPQSDGTSGDGKAAFSSVGECSFVSDNNEMEKKSESNTEGNFDADLKDNKDRLTEEITEYNSDLDIFINKDGKKLSERVGDYTEMCEKVTETQATRNNLQGTALTNQTIGVGKSSLTDEIMAYNSDSDLFDSNSNQSSQSGKKEIIQTLSCNRKNEHEMSLSDISQSSRTSSQASIDNESLNETIEECMGKARNEDKDLTLISEGFSEDARTPSSSQRTEMTSFQSPTSSQSLDNIMAEETEAAKILFSPKSKRKLLKLEDDPGDTSSSDMVGGNDEEWVCVQCDMLNAADITDCDGCLASRPSQADLLKTDVAPVKERQVNLDEVEIFNLFKYRCSQNTTRIFLYRQNESPLNVNFVPLDIEVGNYSELPDILLHPLNLKLVQKFVREWNSLTATKRRVIIRSGPIFSNPAIAYEENRNKTKASSRHLTKETVSAAAVSKAEEVGGSVRVAARPKYSPKRKRKRSKSAEQGQVGHGENKEASFSGLVGAKDEVIEDYEIMTRLRGVVQAIDGSGRPLCVLCHNPYENKLLTESTINDNPWHTRFCTRNCMHQYWIRSSRSYGVDQIFAEEHGCCQLCGLEAHAFFLRVKGTTNLRKRAKLIKDSSYNSLTSDSKEKMVKHPTKGLFWEVDHILPVSEGGGECDVDNLRTLCTPCHRQVTAQQSRDRAKRRRLKEAAACGDITAFFQPK